MGVKDLWQILSPFCERKPLYELEHKTVAIDLSCWVCEAQNLAEYNIQPRMYLRNLYFRTCHLLLMDVNPVFVLEGRAPELKYKTIAARNVLQFKGAKPRSAEQPAGKDRSRFNHTLNLCREMLKIMGLSCIQGEGEAEALCAYLNQDGLVDGIISQDSDCFAYGARKVFRNFSISTQGAHAAKGGSVDVYDIEKAEENLDFGRNKVIALALLCGSDYSEGVHGVGKDSALKLFNRIREVDILDRLQAWRDNFEYFQGLENDICDKNKCSSCGHSGKIQSHTKKGCFLCKTSVGCGTDYKNERLEIKNELNIRSKALQDPNFPNTELINEFLERKTSVKELDLKWTQPDLPKFISFCVKYLTWAEIYAFEKFFPILTRWHLLNHTNSKHNQISIKQIKKKRNPKGVASFELIWEEPNNIFQSLIPEEIPEKLWSTIEPQNLVRSAYPNLVDDFESKGKKPKLKKQSKKRTKISDIEGLLQNISISEPKIKKCKKLNTLDAFLKSSTPIKRVECIEFDLNQSNFGDENDLDVSEIVENIVSSKKQLNLDDKLHELGLQQGKTDEFIENCSFFMCGNLENDLFEKTFNNMSLSESEDDDIVEY